MASLNLNIPHPSVAAGVPFAGTIAVVGARPGANINISLRQVQGSGGWSGGASVAADSQGAGIAAFPAIVLAGIPGGIDIATLLADASDDAGDFFWASSKSVQVI